MEGLVRYHTFVFSFKNVLPNPNKNKLTSYHKASIHLLADVSNFKPVK